MKVFLDTNISSCIHISRLSYRGAQPHKIPLVWSTHTQLVWVFDGRHTASINNYAYINRYA